ncbi:hypothetical protein CVT25_010764 [Psilocybe cyanescens]|uniref:Uncharacterized protein n=1 Tax=Psilocybe cyanescens TaxID=93625 RepID=A0A409W3R5_PSICY|nr:hypothetical protein CVT25_010764 [Psilocybe cyanescens]
MDLKILPDLKQAEALKIDPRGQEQCHLVDVSLLLLHHLDPRVQTPDAVVAYPIERPCWSPMPRTGMQAAAAP